MERCFGSVQCNDDQIMTTFRFLTRGAGWVMTLFLELGDNGESWGTSLRVRRKRVKEQSELEVVIWETLGHT